MKTKPIDYTGCNPKIAECLKRGEAVLCKVWELDKSVIEGEKYVIGWDQYTKKYLVSATNTTKMYSCAKPIETVTKVKKASEVVAWLEERGYEYKPENNAWENVGMSSVFHGAWFVHCGKEGVNMMTLFFKDNGLVDEIEVQDE